MNSIVCKEFVACMENIENSSGSIAKTNFLKESSGNPLVELFCNTVFHPQDTLGSTIAFDDVSEYLRDDMKVDFSEAFRLFKEVLSSLIKREFTGHNAKAELVQKISNFDRETAVWLVRLVNRSAPDGLGYSTVSKIYTNLKVYGNVQCCRGSMNLLETGSSFVAEPKIDGMRVYIHYDKSSGIYKVKSRNNKDLNQNNFKFIIGELEELGVLNKEFAIDGEIASSDWNSSISLAKTKFDLPDDKITQMKLSVFDTFLYQDFLMKGLVEIPYKERRQRLISGCGNSLRFSSLVDSIPVNSEEDCWSNARKFVESTKECIIEGAVIKDVESFYGTNFDNNWIKAKFYYTEDFPVKYIIEGEGRLEGGAGSLAIDVNGVEVNTYGLSYKLSKYLWDKRFEIAAAYNNSEPFYAEVKFLRRTPDGSLREPIFQRLREDK